jgi:hypothetical protein
MDKELIGPISQKEELLYEISSEDEIMDYQDIKEFESQAAEYLREKGIEYDSIPDEDHEVRWVNIHGVKIPEVVNHVSCDRPQRLTHILDTTEK